MITVQTHDFDLAHEYQQLIQPNDTGAIVTFVGRVRDFQINHSQEEKEPARFFLQHYPGMTENVLAEIEAQAHARWPLLKTRIIHRVGHLTTNDQIVFVGVSAAHRKDAFRACEFMIDILKTDAPFWKKEGDTWVEAKTSDQDASDQWRTPPKA